MSSPCSWRCGTIRQANLAAREGMQSLNQGDMARAEALERKALSLIFSLGGFPVLRARLHNNLGVVLAQAGRNAEALRHFAQALQLVQGRVDEETRFHQALAANHSALAKQFPALAA